MNFITCAWATDLHLDHAGRQTRTALLEDIAALKADCLIITGDTGIASTGPRYLAQICEAFQRPVFAVLGNHDFYGDSITAVRAAVAALARDTPNLHYPHEDGVAIVGDVAIAGVDGWGDARYGNWSSTQVGLNDFRLIKELAVPGGRTVLVERLRALGDDSADRLREQLASPAADRTFVLVATHVPPFVEASWHEGRQSDADFTPYFACKATGDVLLEAAAARPDRNILVLCGHTHGGGEARVRPNLRVLTGPAVYERPALQPGLRLPSRIPERRRGRVP
jgi:3',5'-cyclic-AMP phosphodiesterase